MRLSLYYQFFVKMLRDMTKPVGVIDSENHAPSTSGLTSIPEMELDYRDQHPLRYPGSVNVFMEVTHDVVVENSQFLSNFIIIFSIYS